MHTNYTNIEIKHTNHTNISLISNLAKGIMRFWGTIGGEKEKEMKEDKRWVYSIL